MTINGVNYDSYLAAIAQTQAINTKQEDTQTTTQEDRDSYTSSIANIADAIPSGTYGANGMELETFLPVTATGTDSDVSTVETTGTAASGTSASGAADGVSGGGAGGSSDSDDDTETEIVTIDGITYLQTTKTDENGNTTVTRTPIGTAATDDTSTTAGTSTAAQALSAL